MGNHLRGLGLSSILLEPASTTSPGSRVFAEVIDVAKVLMDWGAPKSSNTGVLTRRERRRYTHRAMEAKPSVVDLRAKQGLLGTPESRRAAFNTFLRASRYLDIRRLASRAVRRKSDCLKPPCFGHLQWQP